MNPYWLTFGGKRVCTVWLPSFVVVAQGAILLLLLGAWCGLWRLALLFARWTHTWGGH